MADTATEDLKPAQVPPQSATDDFKPPLPSDIDSANAAVGAGTPPPQVPAPGGDLAQANTGGGDQYGPGVVGGDRPEKGLTDPTDLLDSALGGAAKAVYAGKDFLTGGATPPQDQSELRKAIEGETDRLSDQSIANGFTANVTQFAVGMLGVGKMALIAKALPVVGGLIEGAEASAGAYVTGSAKAALAGAGAFDPHTANVANIVQQVPFLANPVTQYIASNGSDSEALGRVKNALASLGFDAAVAGVFAGAVKLVPWALSKVRGGEEPVGDLAQAHGDLQQAVSDHAAQQEAATAPAPEAAPQGSVEAPEATLAGGPEAPGVEAAAITAPKSATAGAGGSLPKQPKALAVSDDQINTIIARQNADTVALLQHGSMSAASDAGHVFANDSQSIPWQHITPGDVGEGTPIGALITRTASILKEQYDAAKGGDVITDAEHLQSVQQRVALMNQDPVAIMGMLQAAGKQAQALRADMDAAFIWSAKTFKEAYAQSVRINADYYGFSGPARDAANATMIRMAQLAATAHAAGLSIMSNSARALRGAQEALKMPESFTDAIASADPDMVGKILAGTGGDMRNLAVATAPALWSPAGIANALKRGASYAQFAMVNNLTSNVYTHAVILATNSYMVLSRPFERIVGGSILQAWHALQGNDVAGAEAAGVRTAALRQYSYTTSVLHDSFQQAVDAWKNGDSIMAPHTSEMQPASGGSNWFGEAVPPEAVTRAQSSVGQDIAQADFKEFDSIPNLLSNILLAAGKVQGAPTRFIGMQDELVKQIVYRAKVMADAHVEGQAAGLDGSALTDHVQSRLSSAFDDAGKATDLATLNEAKVATFQQDLPNNGSGMSQYLSGKALNDFVNNAPMLRLVLPFVKTPLNIFRTGIKLTPGLNMIQEEFRNAIRGKMGVEAQSQAIGQMATGSLFMGVAAYLASQGRITGSLPSNPEQGKNLLDTGWRPYSMVNAQSDGKLTYVQLGRFDPAAMPFFMMADIMDAAAHHDPDVQSKAQPMAEAMVTALIKNMTDKMYLSNLKVLIDAAHDPDANFWKTAGQYAGQFVPFSSALHMANPDPYMREAYNFIDKVKSTLPGFSQSVPARRDAFGDPVTAHKGIFMTDNGSVVDHEVNRLVTEQKLQLNRQGASVGGADLRNITMVDGSNAYDKLQELSRKPDPKLPMTQKEAVADFMTNPKTAQLYHDAPDGSSETPGTKLSIMLGIMHAYREPAMAQVMADPNVAKAVSAERMRVSAAYAANQKNPTHANNTSAALDSLTRATGVDLKAMPGVRP